VATPAADETLRYPVSGRLRAAALVIVVLAALAQLGRAVVKLDGDGAAMLLCAGLIAAYLVLFTLAVLRPPARLSLRHLLLAVQSLLVLVLLSLDPRDLDSMTALFVPLAFQAAMAFRGRATWFWVAVLAALTAGSLMVYLGPLDGLARALTSIAAEIVFAAFVVVAGEIEGFRRQSQTMLDELQATNARLQEYAARAGELAAADERDRVARDLNASVAMRIAGILEGAEMAREALVTPRGSGRGEVPAGGSGDAPADEAAPLLAALQAQTQEALAEMRGLIAELRPKAG